jgi:hypothetical protein
MGYRSWDHDDVINRTSSQIWTSRTRLSLKRWLIPLLLGFPLGGLIVLGTIGLLFYAGPQLESHFGPTIIKAAHIAGSVRRTSRELCWNTKFEKFDGRPPLLFVYIISLRGYQIPVPAYRLNPDGKKIPLSQAGFAHHERGETWISTYCIDLPEALLSEDDVFVVDGIGYYTSKTKLWRVPVDLPSFAVDPKSVGLWEQGSTMYSRQGQWTELADHFEPSGRVLALQNVLELVHEEN